MVLFGEKVWIYHFSLNFGQNWMSPSCFDQIWVPLLSCINLISNNMCVWFQDNKLYKPVVTEFQNPALGQDYDSKDSLFWWSSNYQKKHFQWSPNSMHYFKWYSFIGYLESKENHFKLEPHVYTDLNITCHMCILWTLLFVW